MNEDISAAVVARLVSVLPGDVTVYDGKVDSDPPPRYVAVWGDIGTIRALAIDGVSRDASYSIQVTSVVTAPMDAADCRWLARQVRNAIADWRPVADDLSVPGQFAHDISRRPVDDESIPDRHVMFAVDLFSLAGIRS